jgi:hypothetical protein
MERVRFTHRNMINKIRIILREYWCEECEQQQPSPHIDVDTIHDPKGSENLKGTQFDQEGYYTDEERNELDVLGQEDF